MPVKTSMRNGCMPCFPTRIPGFLVAPAIASFVLRIWNRGWIGRGRVSKPPLQFVNELEWQLNPHKATLLHPAGKQLRCVIAIYLADERIVVETLCIQFH